MQLSVITDEISQDLGHALDVCQDLGLHTVELRAVDGTSVVAHDAKGLARIKAALDARELRVCAIASPFLKCHLHGDGAAPGETHRAASASKAEQWGILERSLEVAHLLGAPIVRAFSFWRVADPASVREEVVEALTAAVRRAESAGILLGLENEYACNVGTGAETGWVLHRIPSSTFGVIWDPGNEAKLGSRPFPDGYAHIRRRVMHVQLKDLDAQDRWVKVGTGVIDFPGLLRALVADGYEGALSLETHYATPEGGPEGATRESIAALRTLCATAGVKLV
jgi:sugar phosphate isomerase/epimerase